MDMASLLSTRRVKGSGYTFKRGNSVKIVLPPFWKGVLLNRKKKQLLKGSKLFPFNPFLAELDMLCLSK